MTNQVGIVHLANLHLRLYETMRLPASNPEVHKLQLALLEIHLDIERQAPTVRPAIPVQQPSETRKVPVRSLWSQKYRIDNKGPTSSAPVHRLYRLVP